MKLAITAEILNPSPSNPSQASMNAKYEIRYHRLYNSISDYQMISTNSNTFTFDNTIKAAGFA